MILYRDSGYKLKSFERFTSRPKNRGSFLLLNSSGEFKERTISELKRSDWKSLMEQDKNSEEMFRLQTDNLDVGHTDKSEILSDLLNLHLESSSTILLNRFFRGEKPPLSAHNCPNAFTQFFAESEGVKKTRARRLLAASADSYGVITSNGKGLVMRQLEGYSWAHELLFSRIERAYANRIRSISESAFLTRSRMLTDLHNSVVSFGARADISFFLAMQTMRDKRLYAKQESGNPLLSEKRFINTLLGIAEEIYERVWCLWTSQQGLCFGEQPISRYEIKHSEEGFYFPLSRWTLLDISPKIFGGETHTMIAPAIVDEDLIFAYESALGLYEAKLIEKISVRSETIFCHPNDWRSMESLFHKSFLKKSPDLSRMLLPKRPMDTWTQQMPDGIRWEHHSSFHGPRSPSFEIIATVDSAYIETNEYWKYLFDYAQSDKIRGMK